MSYITPDDIKSVVFNRFKAETQEYYAEVGSDAIEDLYYAKVPTEDRTGINLPLHSQLLRYGVQCALQEFAQDRTGANNSNGASTDDDVYTRMFKQASYRAQDLKKSIVTVMFVGGAQTPQNRAIRPVGIQFG